MSQHVHWEVDSICPQCGNVNHVVVPAGEHVIRVACQHCPHGYEYTHVVQEHEIVEDDEDGAEEA
ncbi:MAG: hypothetical protein K6T76_00295 [Alicyclobacillus mali]|uniref:hypothetical protein n=1 Tax=Alicyclobacillus mali (ex Roth et al. 2021) TaxID=1123961 RepID=UPI0023F1A81B|nr:hypothetical protein [Alicyclobacillus mali (ex Roth et al. 2021)]MCL6487367.1 hypothetical protein [Alicyclobacillus mali (ex Roth et al. 2021)]